MRRLLFITLLFLVFILMGCSDNAPKDKEENVEENNNQENDNNEDKKGSLYIRYVFNDGRDDLIELVTNASEYEFLEPEREGYSFEGWYKDSELYHELDNRDLVLPVNSKDITINAYAEWHLNRYLVKFMRDGYLLTSQMVKHGESAREPSVPIKPGYRFVGWDVDFSNVKSDLEVNAIYVENSESKNIMVVLGNWMNNDGTISSTMRTRLELALKAYQEFKFDYIVVSGGMANTVAGISEAQAMYDYLVAHGIDKNIIIKEDQSLSTLQNAQFTINKLQDYDFKNLVIVSTIEHFVKYDTIKYFNDAIQNNAKVKNKNINILIYTNNGTV